MTRPPRLATALLRLRDFDGHRDEIEDDLLELFEKRALESVAYARRRYWRDVLSFFAHRSQDGARQLTGPGEGAGSMAAWWFDLRQLVRAVRRQPAFFVLAALTLGVGFAAHLAAYGIVDRLLLSPPPQVGNAEAVFQLRIERADVAGGRFLWWQTPYKVYHELRAHTRSFSALAAYRSTRASLGSGAAARMVSVTFADEHYFPLLGVSASRGRVFGADENQPPSGNAVLVLSDAYWRSAYGADENAIGQTVRIGARTYTVIGVAPPGFTGATPEPVDGWAPLHAGALDLPPIWTTSAFFRSVNVLVRLAPGTPSGVAADESGAAYRRTSEGTPAADPTARIVLGSLLPGRLPNGELTREARVALLIEGVSILVLLVAIANVINLQMSRAAQQRREMAVRAALGAGRARLLSKLILETLAIAAAGVAVGVALTYWSATALHQLLLPGVPAVIDAGRFGLVSFATIIVRDAAGCCGRVAAGRYRRSHDRPQNARH